MPYFRLLFLYFSKFSVVGDNDSDDEYISRSVKAKMGRGGKRGPRGRGAKKTGLDRHSARKHTPRIKPPSIDDDYEQLEPQFQCHLCPKVFDKLE